MFDILFLQESVSGALSRHHLGIGDKESCLGPVVGVSTGSSRVFWRGCFQPFENILVHIQGLWGGARYCTCKACVIVKLLETLLKVA